MGQTFLNVLVLYVKVLFRIRRLICDSSQVIINFLFLFESLQLKISLKMFGSSCV